MFEIIVAAPIRTIPGKRRAARPGGYRFTDYARLGWVLTLTVLVLTVTLVPVLWRG